MSPSGKSVNGGWREMAASPTERSWCVLEFARLTVLWGFNARWTSWSLVKPQTFLFQTVVTSCILFNICENMVLQNTPIIYTRPVLIVCTQFTQVVAGRRLDTHYEARHMEGFWRILRRDMNKHTYAHTHLKYVYNRLSCSYVQRRVLTFFLNLLVKHLMFDIHTCTHMEVFPRR
jgi:hypothetical protein